MTGEGLNNQDTSTNRKPENIRPSTGKKQSRAIWIVFLVFFAFVAIVFLTQRKASIDWVEDYQVGLELAKRQNKPVLLAFYKQFTIYSTRAINNTYNNPDVKKFVEQNFIPILIDVDKQPEIAERYKIGYYPTHYIKQPDSDDIFGPMMGFDPPSLFIKKLKDLLQEMGQLDE